MALATPEGTAAVSPTTTRLCGALLKSLLETSPLGEGRPVWDPLRRGHPAKGAVDSTTACDHFGKGDVSARGIAALRRIRNLRPCRTPAPSPVPAPP
jgi:hypothetical protein